ncbi:MAG: ribosome silencing factor [Verrucomicrobia bacterium]|nr:ribosome silencing factor [Verrucomicrobiota bacterium]
MPTTKKTTATKKTSTTKRAAAKSKTTKTTASRVGTTAKRTVKKAAGTPAKKTCAAKKSPAKKKAPAVKENPSAGIGLVKRCVAALEEKKASAIEIIYLGEKSPVTDYYVIATGTSDPHLRALRIELEKAIHEVVPAGQVRIQNEPNSGWCVVDAFDVVVHIFSEEQRKNYALEELWKDGEKIEL